MQAKPPSGLIDRHERSRHPGRPSHGRLPHPGRDGGQAPTTAPSLGLSAPGARAGPSIAGRASPRSKGAMRGVHDDPDVRRTPGIEIGQVGRASSLEIANRDAGKARADIRKIIRPVVVHKVAMGRAIDRPGRSRPPQQTEYRSPKNSRHPGLARLQRSLLPQVRPPREKRQPMPAPIFSPPFGRTNVVAAGTGGPAMCGQKNPRGANR